MQKIVDKIISRLLLFVMKKVCFYAIMFYVTEHITDEGGGAF
ncbi:hypothetical protein HMPREF3195_00172 [Peptostreptococcus anaerobius]|uniref:Uncharacterized protein n=1 Tax=Peptostreptococcus anaerobius TaxID=1261 RepID=A0A135YYQ8_9FIRM|nr:hypothetical protein HMPREF3195_00172 [Peptostreptococcus anaerobius]